MIGSIKLIWDKLLEIMYPKRCLLCDGILSYGFNERLCEGCKVEGVWIQGDLCSKCGKPLEAHRLELCFDCSKKTHYYDEGRAMWLYQGSIKKAIQRYKYGERKGYGKAFALELHNYYSRNINWKIDMLTSVPLHPNKLRERSFNQSALIADKLSVYLGIVVNNELLIRVKNTKPQKDLSDIERIHNVRDAFSVNDLFSCRGKNILIVDDIYTTGSTIDSCAKVLKNHGASNVYFLALAIGKGL